MLYWAWYDGEASFPPLQSVFAMHRYLKFLDAPLNAVRTAVIILSDSCKEILRKIKASFARGPVSEMSEYIPMVKNFFKSQAKKFRSRFAAAKEFMSSKTGIDAKR